MALREHVHHAGDDETASLLSPDDDASRRLRDRRKRPTFTVQSSIVATAIGIVVCLSNTYFGLQNGHGDSMAMPSSLLGFGIIQLLRSQFQVTFGVEENIFISTLAGAIGTMPITAGLVSAIAAIEYILPADEGGRQDLGFLTLVVWSVGLCMFGILFATLLREYILPVPDMPFPSATATSTIVAAIHGRRLEKDIAHSDHDGRNSFESESRDPPNGHDDNSLPERIVVTENLSPDAFSNMLIAIALSGLITIIVAMFPILRNVPLLGTHLASEWLWTLNMSPGMFGQGMIAGPVITGNMLLGAMVGWGILSPVAKLNGWAPGPIGSWESGSRGWILWISLTILVVDCLINMIGTLGQWLFQARKQRPVELDDGHLSRRFGVRPTGRTWYRLALGKGGAVFTPGTTSLVVGLLLATLLCTATTSFTFSSQISLGEIILAVLLALGLSVASIRALGTADNNPASGLAKLSQFAFALVFSRSRADRLVNNIAIGAIAEAGAVQAGFMMFDFKMGHLLGASSRVQMVGYMVGSVIGSVVSVLFYKLYTTAYPVPGALLQVPTAHMWVSAARFAYGERLPPYCLEFCIAFAIVFAVLSAFKMRFAGIKWIPSGVAFALGFYNPPAFILPRVLGALAIWHAQRKFNVDATALRMIAAGLILGESLFSIIALLLPMEM